MGGLSCEIPRFVLLEFRAQFPSIIKFKVPRNEVEKININFYWRVGGVLVHIPRNNIRLYPFEVKLASLMQLSSSIVEADHRKTSDYLIWILFYCVVHAGEKSSLKCSLTCTFFGFGFR